MYSDLIKYAVSFNPKQYKKKYYTLPTKIEENTLVRYIWHLKTLVRCLLSNSKEKYILGSGKIKLPYISRILFSIDDNKLVVLCLLEDSICDLVFRTVEMALTIDEKTKEEIIKGC